MQLVKTINGGDAWTRRYLTGVTVVKEQVVCVPALGGNGVIGAPASVNDYSEALGITTEAVTYSTTQGSAGNLCEIVCAPFAIFKGKVSGGATADTAFALSLDNALLLNSTTEAAGATVADTNVGTSEYVGGYLVGLSGANKGFVRVIDSHTDNTSTVVDDVFDNDITAGDTFLRTFSPAMGQGMELTTNFVQFNGVTSAGVDLPDTGHGVCVGVKVDGQPADTGFVQIRNATAPEVEVELILIDHYFNSVA